MTHETLPSDCMAGCAAVHRRDCGCGRVFPDPVGPGSGDPHDHTADPRAHGQCACGHRRAHPDRPRHSGANPHRSAHLHGAAHPCAHGHPKAHRHAAGHAQPHPGT